MPHPKDFDCAMAALNPTSTISGYLRERLRHISIKDKLSIFLIVSCTLTLGIACALFYGFFIEKTEKSYRIDLQSLADLLAENCSVPLYFNVPEDAKAVLATTKARKSIVASYVFDQNGVVFASFTKNGSATHGPSLLKTESQITTETGEPLGRLVLIDDRDPLIQIKFYALAIILLATTVVMLSVITLGPILRDLIANPIERLTDAVSQFSIDNPATLDGISLEHRDDEIGVLSNAFHTLGINLHTTYQNLLEKTKLIDQSRLDLKKQVEARTKALTNALHHLRESQAQLVQSEKMVAIGQLVAGIAHEINNNINFISSATMGVEALIKKWPRATDTHGQQLLLEKLTTTIAHCKEGVRRTKKIVQDLKSFSRPGEQKFVKAQINEELEKILNLLHYELKHGVLVVKHFEQNLPEIDCLPEQLGQVWINIIMNAVHAMEGTGTLNIETAHSGESIYVKIKDTGPGIPEQYLNRVFEPFFTTKEPGKGTGLGLSLSYQVVQNHHGSIHVRTKKDEGTEFVILLPIARKNFKPGNNTTELVA